MMWVRKGIVGLLSLLLFVALVGGALSTSANIAFTHPDKIEAWLNQSHFYDSVISNAIDQAQKSAASSGGTGVSLNDPAVKQAAQKAFTPEELQQDVNTILNSNYAWLQGKTSKPSFSVSLTSAKQNFADQVAEAVQSRLTGLPVCTKTQLAQLANSSQNLQNIDPFSIPCRPPGLSPAAEAATAKQDVLTNDSFLGNNPALTANSLNASGTTESQPYYQQFSAAPKLYRLSVALPWVYAVVALLCLVGIFFITPIRRRGLRHIAIILGEAGVVLLIIKFLADKSLPGIERRVFSSANAGAMQHSLSTFLNLVEAQLTKIDFWFGVAYLVLAIVLFIYLLTTRGRGPKPAPTPVAPAEPAQPKPTPPAPASHPSQPPRPKTPRLIQ